MARRGRRIWSGKPGVKSCRLLFMVVTGKPCCLAKVGALARYCHAVSKWRLIG